MTRVVGVQFKSPGKIYYFSPTEEKLEKNTPVIVETARGVEYGMLVVEEKDVPEEELFGELKPILRKATEEDNLQYMDNRNRSQEAYYICLEKIAENNLDMKVLSLEYTFDRSKLIFYFTAEHRVDFRKLVRDLAAVFRTRIELVQIGVRDEATLLGGLATCGRETCCSSFLTEFTPVTIKMAKDQNLSLNPTNISGLCGRLMCCLKYEQEGYEEGIKKLPRVGHKVMTPVGEGVVIDLYTIMDMVKVKVKVDDTYEIHGFHVDEIGKQCKSCHKKSRKKKQKREAVEEEPWVEIDTSLI